MWKWEQVNAIAASHATRRPHSSRASKNVVSTVIAPINAESARSPATVPPKSRIASP